MAVSSRPATPSELYENAQNAFVANFVGENNGLTGRVVNTGEDWATLALADGSIIRGRCEPGLRTGDEAMLALRPERAHIPVAEGTHVDEHSNRGAGARRGTGVLRRSSSRASRARFVRCLRRESAQYAAHALPSPGSTIEIAWRHDDCKILAVSVPRSAPTSHVSAPPSPSLITTAPAGAN